MDSPAYNDLPITEPAEDRFGVEPFAKALATSFRKMASPTGSVIALNGPWGSGKSSAVNLVKFHLDAAVKADEISIVNFASWWFRGEEAVALAFFRELYTALAPSLGEKVRKAIPKLGARLLKAGSALGGAADAAGAAGMGSAVGGAMEWLGNLIESDESVEKLHAELSKALAEQKKRFLIVIDDIDRLSPEEALVVFRMVKSVGRLPNVMYLLVYDRQLAERIVSERYPSEGPHYLEKIVQAAFELPEPQPSDVQQHLLELIEKICGACGEDPVRFMNIFREGVAPHVKSPRDVARFANSLSVTWPAVAGEVSQADFLALETLRLHFPDVYRAVRQNKELVSGSLNGRWRREDDQAENTKRLLLGDLTAPSRERVMDILKRLFPALEGLWGGMTYGGDFVRSWSKDRLVCSPAHFDAYFRFALGDAALSKAELELLISHSGDKDYIAATLKEAVKVQRRSGATKASLLLDELNTHADRVPIENLVPLLSGLFEVADDIHVEADESRGFSIGNNEYRLHWLLRSLTRERMELVDRSAVLLQASEHASLGWLAELFRSAWVDYHPRKGAQPSSQEKCITTEPDAVRLRGMLKERIQAAAKDGTLGSRRSLAFLLAMWNLLAEDDGLAVKTWTAGLITSDAGVATLAKAFTSFGWSQSAGDLVAKRSAMADVKNLDNYVDAEAFRQRAESVAAKETYPEVGEFLRAWDRANKGEGFFD